MTALIVLGSILLVLLILMMIPVGGKAEYAQTGLSLVLELGPVTVPLYPKIEKKSKQKKKRTKPEDKKTVRKETAQKGKQGGSFTLFRQMLPIFCEALGKLKQRLKISFTLYYTAGGEDAAQTAIQFGRVLAGLGSVIALLENHFCIQKREVQTAVDFKLSQPIIYFAASVRIRIGQVLYLATRYGIACIRVYQTHRKEQTEQKKKKAV